ncbi:hypothetical protein [Kutzneria kofuensis]|uniref:hypothetical protein n=1 Tax=Kutzneria kofuensis TaxID=103725 RepID=UPI0031ECD4C8
MGAPATIDERVRRWSVYQPWLQEDPVTPWNELREHGPVLRSEEAGGYWILTRYEDIEWAARNPEIFSSAQVGIPHRDVFPVKQIPIQLDGEEHRKWRQTLSDLFNPGVVNHFEPQIRQAAVDAIEPIVEKGRCEFITEFATSLPAETFLINFGIGREYLQPLLAHKTWLRREGIPNARTDEELHAANRPLWQFFSDAIDRRRAEGTEGRMDVFSRLVESTYDGRKPTQDEMVNAAFVSMLASLDTHDRRAGHDLPLSGRAPRGAAAGPRRAGEGARDRRGAHPARARLHHRPDPHPGRGAARRDHAQGRPRDAVVGHVGLDPDVFERPLEVDFDRSSTRQLAFGIGPHRCLGMHVARRIVRIALEEWHTRIPSYHVTAASIPVRHYSPARGVARLELTIG